MAIVIGAEFRTSTSGLAREAQAAGRIITSTIGGAFRSVTATAGGLIRTMTSVKGAIIGIAAGYGFDRVIKQAGALEVQVKALQNRLGISRRGVNDYISAVNNASKGLLDFQVATQLANQAMMMGIPRDRIARLVELTTVLATAAGDAEGAEQAIEGLMTAFATGRQTSLQRFGIMIDPKSLEGLSLQDRQAKILAESLRQLEAKTKAMGVTGRETFFTYVGIFGNIKDIVNELGRAALRSKSLQGLFQSINTITGNIAETLRNESMGDVLKGVFSDVVKLAAAAAQDIGEILGRGIVKALGTALLGTMPRLAKLMGLDAEAIKSITVFDQNSFSRTREAMGNLGARFTPQGGASAAMREALGGEFRPEAIAPEKVAEARKKLGDSGYFAGQVKSIQDALLKERESDLEQRPGEHPIAYRRRVGQEREKARREAQRIAQEEQAALRVVARGKVGKFSAADIAARMAAAGGDPEQEARLREEIGASMAPGDRLAMERMMRRTGYTPTPTMTPDRPAAPVSPAAPAAAKDNGKSIGQQIYEDLFGDAGKVFQDSIIAFARNWAEEWEKVKPYFKMFSDALDAFAVGLVKIIKDVNAAIEVLVTRVAPAAKSATATAMDVVTSDGGPTIQRPEQRITSVDQGVGVAAGYGIGYLINQQMKQYGLGNGARAVAADPGGAAGMFVDELRRGYRNMFGNTGERGAAAAATYADPGWYPAGDDAEARRAAEAAAGMSRGASKLPGIIESLANDINRTASQMGG